MTEQELAQFAASRLDEHKAEDIIVMDVSRITPFASYYVIATLGNERALGAIADTVADEIEKAGGTIRSIEGKPETAWVLVDCFGVIIHLFLDWSRKEIKLDDLVGERVNKLVAKEA